MGTGAIPLGGAGNNPNDQKTGTTIPIPEVLPNDPVVLTDGIDTAPTCGPTGPAGADGVDGADGIGVSPPEDTTINRDVNDLIESVVTASKTVNITRDVDGQITSVEDGVYQKDIIRTGGLISFIDVTKL